MTKSTIGLAVSVVLGSSAAWAQVPPAAAPAAPAAAAKKDPGPVIATTATAKNLNDVSLKSDIKTNNQVAIEGNAQVIGTIRVDSSSLAAVDNKQFNHDNSVDNTLPPLTDSNGNPVEQLQSQTFHSQTAAIAGGAGNLGVNVTSGENNQQDNAAAIAAADATFLQGGSTNAQVSVNQSVWNNSINVNGATYTASTGTITGNAGNTGVNVSSGVSDVQKNGLAISSGHSRLAAASSAALQETYAITTTAHYGRDVNGPVQTTYTSNLGGITGNAGNTGVNLATGNNNLQANSLSIASTR